jgi:hypothetical protein
VIAIPANLRRFRDRPAEALVALLPSQAAALAAAERLQAAGCTIDGAHLFSGRAGARILDRYWAGRGLLARLRPDLRKIGYYEVALSRYGSGLRGGGALLIIPADRGAARPMERVLEAHGARAVSYLGRASADKLGQT